MRQTTKLFLAATLVLAATTAPAQQLGMMKRGETVLPDGSRAYVNPSTTLAVDITVKRVETVTGPYARYAQRYFGVIAPLADKCTYTIEAVRIGTPEDCGATTGCLTTTAEAAPAEFPRVLPDKMSSATVTTEEAAAQAARRIFELRKRRIELVTGEYAETVYGAGLSAALERMDAMEAELLELFFGKRSVTVTTRRVLVVPAADAAATVVCRFRDTAGILSADDLSGEPVMLECRPQGLAARLLAPEGRRGKSSNDAAWMVQDLVSCRVTYGREELADATIPMYQFGVATTIATK